MIRKNDKSYCIRNTHKKLRFRSRKNLNEVDQGREVTLDHRDSSMIHRSYCNSNHNKIY
jgi:hypothetical protein